jgi:hypothetical protein
MDRTKQLSEFNTILGLDKSWCRKINDIVSRFLTQSVQMLGDQTREIIELNTKFIDQLSQIKNEIQNESLTQLFHPLNDRCMDLVQVNYSSKNGSMHKEVIVPLGTPNFKNIIIIGDIEYPTNTTPLIFQYRPLEMLDLTHKIVEVNEILFIYPEYELIIRDRLEINYGHLKLATITVQIEAVRLDINPIFWCQYASYLRRKGILIQFGYTTNPQEIRNRIVERTIKILWSSHLQLKMDFEIALNNDDQILPNYTEIVWRRIHNISLSNYVMDRHGMPGAFNDHIIAFYDSTSEPGRIVNEVSKVLPQWIPKHLLTHSYIHHMFEKTMLQIGDSLDSNQIIEVICCMEHFGEYLRDLVPIMFEIMMVI